MLRFLSLTIFGDYVFVKLDRAVRPENRDECVCLGLIRGQCHETSLKFRKSKLFPLTLSSHMQSGCGLLDLHGTDMGDLYQ